MINNITLVGRLARDPDLRYSRNGVAICNCNLAVNRGFESRDGQDADFINFVAFKGAAEALANYQKKGNLIGVTGRIQTRNYENKEGKRVFVTEVVANSVQFLESKNQGSKNPSERESINQYNNDVLGNDVEPLDINDSDLPF